MKYTVLSSDKNTSARIGLIETDHGTIETPIFMPVGTHGAVKTLSPQELEHAEAQIILGNTYHLYLRPGHQLIQKAGGLHGFANWKKPILTDSGGFQVFSLATLNKITDDGVEFRSHLNGSKHFFTPNVSMDIQRHLGSDIIMAFDECPPGNADNKTILNAVNRTTKWIAECADYLKNTPPIHPWEQVLFPIVQGGIVPELRRQSAESVIPFITCGIAIGGLAVGEEKNAMFDTIALMDEVLPKDHPRYLMGVGTPADLVESVMNGVDMFDCVMPTRNARNGQLFTSTGKLNIRNGKYKDDFSVVDETCTCPLCQNHTRAYLRHLLNVNEIYGLRLASLHNVTYYLNLMKEIRTRIKDGSFSTWANQYLALHKN